MNEAGQAPRAWVLLVVATAMLLQQLPLGALAGQTEMEACAIRCFCPIGEASRHGAEGSHEGPHAAHATDHRGTGCRKAAVAAVPQAAAGHQHAAASHAAAGHEHAAVAPERPASPDHCSIRARCGQDMPFDGAVWNGFVARPAVMAVAGWPQSLVVLPGPYLEPHLASPAPPDGPPKPPPRFVRS